MTAWHEGAKSQSKPVTVSGNSTSGFHVEQINQIAAERQRLSRPLQFVRVEAFE